MPLYEYVCGACHRKQEVLQKVADDPITTCPLCGADQLERLVSASAFHLKGGAWYADGYHKKAGDAAPVDVSADQSTKKE